MELRFGICDWRLGRTAACAAWVTAFACAAVMLAQDAAPATTAEEPAATAGQAAPADVITFHKTLAAAQREGGERRQVTAAFFTATWCHWCRKLSDTTLRDERVVAVAKRFNWAKIDIDRQPETAAVFNVRGVPALVLLNAAGEVIDASAGFLTAEQMLAFLNKSVDEAEAPGAAAKLELAVKQMHEALAGAKTDADALAAVLPVVELLARPDRPRRAWLSEQVAQARPAGWVGLLQAMSDKRLAIRAAAAAALAAATRAGLPFDPFADDDGRRPQVDAWRQWVAEHRDRPSSGAKPSGVN